MEAWEDRMDLLYLSRRDPVHVPVRAQELYVNPPYHVKEGERYQPPRFIHESWMVFSMEEKRLEETFVKRGRRNRNSPRPSRPSHWDKYAKRNARQREEEIKRHAAEIIADQVRWDDVVRRWRQDNSWWLENGKEPAD